LGKDAVVLERRGPSGVLHVILNVRGPLEHRLPAGAELVLWSEAPRFGGASQEEPLRSGVLRLEGPMAAVVRVTG
ncbi:MAG TPA: malto-oligosyltrehalose trehalohydrolase, partial [Archangium sp.]|nr:malto-oligosyltrehalose trehalohydrolase [Archangium sp.]